MNKIRKYKKGDKVLWKNSNQNIWWPDTQPSGTIFTIRKIRENRWTYLEESPEKHMNWNANRFEYYYEKPLKELENEIKKYSSKYDYKLIQSFVNREETLTDEELQKCRKLWEKYNNL